MVSQSLMELSSVIIKPADCILAIAIPTTKKSFLANLNSVNDIDFTRRNLLQMHTKEFIKPAKGAIKRIINKGVEIHKDVSFNDFNNILKKNFKALILFAHNFNDRIEFYDGLYEAQTVNAIIPNKVFIFDLNSCNCDTLAELVSATKTNIVTKYGQYRKTIPLYWILFYEYFFELLNQKQLTYFDAMQYTYNNFSKKLLI
ncbi:MAG TPA: hypothetical protein VJY62_11140 [Bacteroidia bacterium]|nr:hypothetical protein [Bacteroidia bacterium]